MAPVVALGEPDRLVRRREVAPVHGAVARLEERLGFLLEHLADGARRGVRHAQLLAPVIARGRDERDRRSVGAPLHVGPLAAARDVVAERRSVLVGRHLEPDDLSGIDLDADALNHRDRVVARQRILPRLQRRMPGVRVDEVHLADASLILLERRDLLRVRRPDEDRPIAARPSGVVRRVAEILHAVRGHGRLPAARDVAQPQIPIADERGALAVGRRHVEPRRDAAPSAAVAALQRRPAGRQVARALRAVFGGHDERLGALLGRRAVPEALTACVGNPRHAPGAVQDERVGVVRHEALGARIVCCRERRHGLLLSTRGERGGGDEKRDERSAPDERTLDGHRRRL